MDGHINIKKLKIFIRYGFLYKTRLSEPIIKMRLIDDGKNDKSQFNDLLVNSQITFEMSDVKNGFPVILNGQCSLALRTKKYQQTTDELYIIYQFSEEETSITGKFEGKFIIQFTDEEGNNTNKLIVPIREKLFIHVI